MPEAVGAPKRSIILVHLSSILLTEALTTHLSGRLADFHFQTPAEIRCNGHHPALILADSSSIADRLHDEYAGSRTLVVDTRLEQRDIVRLNDQHSIAGVLATHSTLALMEKALIAVLAGDFWFERDILQALIRGHASLRGAQASGDAPDLLSDREKEVIHLICEGCTNKEVAGRLGLAEQTIKAHLSRIFKKMKVTNRSQLVATCTRKDLL